MVSMQSVFVVFKDFLFLSADFSLQILHILKRNVFLPVFILKEDFES